jgi:uncharacterized membrane protein YhaH (DUF805 family)
VPERIAVRLRSLPRLWLTFEARVDRRAYALSGIGLAALKYLGDAAIVWTAAGRAWTPGDYARPAAAVFSERFAAASPWLLLALAAWTLPFLWIAVSMSMRRALDAGRSAWLALLVFVPWARYALMLALALLPARPPGRPAPRPRPYERRLPSALLAVAAGTLVALGALALSVYGLAAYGLALFLGTPFVVGAITAWIFNRRYPASPGETVEVVTLTLACVGGVLLLVAAEGALCLLMAAPLALGIGIMGGALGRRIAGGADEPASHAALALLTLPLGAALDARQEPAGLREVRSAVVIAAPPAAVWDAVIAFPPLPRPSELVFRLGVAHPVRARLDGRGVGAVRYCEFSTGAFVEPITAWEPGRRLAFDVAEHPRPLMEWSPYRDVVPPHLDHYFRSRRGEFRLVALPDGRTRLEGSTWYELRIEPVAYWTIFADAIVHRIHGRVLEHVKVVAEGRR